MGVIIHDDYYEAMMQLPQKQRAPFIEAVVQFGFTGDEPDGSPPWLPVFTVLKKRISLSSERAKAGSKGGAKRKQKRSKIESSYESDSHLPSRVEDEVEYEYEDTPSFPLSCIDVLNRILGTTYSDIPDSCKRTLGRFESTYQIADVEAMIQAKREEWQGDSRTRGWLTPHTLFAPEKFEKYMIQTLQAREEAAHGYDHDDEVL